MGKQEQIWQGTNGHPLDLWPCKVTHDGVDQHAGTPPRGDGAARHQVLAGLIERVTFHNPENGFCVARVKARGHRDLVTMVGHAAAIGAGEWMTATGEWVNDRNHGQQFRARFMRLSPPTTAEGKLPVTTGGTGVGKTTIMGVILQILSAKGVRLLLAATVDGDRQMQGSPADTPSPVGPIPQRRASRPTKLISVISCAVAIRWPWQAAAVRSPSVSHRPSRRT